MCLTLLKKFYLIMLFWVQYKITHRIQFEFETSSSSKTKTETNLDSREIEILHSSCLVRCNHFESLHRGRLLRTLFTRMHARIVAASCLIFCSSRKIHSRRIRFLLTFWRTWFFESKMIQFACWKWFSKSNMRLKKCLRNITNNVIWLTNFKTKERFYKKELLFLKTTRLMINILFVS